MHNGVLQMLCRLSIYMERNPFLLLDLHRSCKELANINYLIKLSVSFSRLLPIVRCLLVLPRIISAASIENCSSMITQPLVSQKSEMQRAGNISCPFCVYVSVTACHFRSIVALSVVTLIYLFVQRLVALILRSLPLPQRAIPGFIQRLPRSLAS